MHESSIRAVVCAAVLFSAVTAGPAHSAGPTLKDIQGAWLGQETGCEAVFTFAGGKPTFRRPADAFIPAFIVSGDRLYTPLAACRIQKLEETDKGTRITMTCANALSSAPVVTRFAFGRGYLLRISDSGVETGYYNNCKSK
jgi:hypothetical protein